MITYYHGRILCLFLKLKRKLSAYFMSLKKTIHLLRDKMLCLLVTWKIFLVSDNDGWENIWYNSCNPLLN